MGPWLSWESAAFASLWSHIDLRVSAHDFGENFLRNLLKSKNFENPLFVAKTRKKRRYGPIAQLGERSVRIREVEGFESLWVHHFEKNHRHFGGDFSFDHNYTTDGRKS